MESLFPRELTGWKKLANEGRKLREASVVEEKIPTQQELVKLELIKKLLSMNDKEFEFWNRRRYNWEKHSQRVQEILNSQ